MVSQDMNIRSEPAEEREEEAVWIAGGRGERCVEMEGRREMWKKSER